MSNRVASGHAEKCTLSKALLIFLGEFFGHLCLQIAHWGAFIFLSSSRKKKYSYCSVGKVFYKYVDLTTGFHEKRESSTNQNNLPI